jgi:YidC/Oxa1 family membrane protein insertase
MSFLDPLFNFFGAILAFFYGLVPNLGAAIILLTVAVMLVLFPLTAKQARAMLNMQRAQPEIKKIQEKYKGDKAKQNEEVMKFYQENKINPLAGCLPLLVQMPIFLSLFHLMRNPYQYIPTSSKLFAAFCTSPKTHQVVSETACSKPPLPAHLSFLGMDLSLSAIGAHDGFLSALPYFLLVGLVIVTGFMQARQSKRNAPNMNSQMAMVTQILPIGFGLFSLQFPSGLVLYYFVSNLWRLGQQELIMRKITRPGMEAINAAKENGGGAIDVKGTEKDPTPGRSGAATATLDAPEPKGLRKLFRPALPAASSEPGGNGNSTNGGNGANGAAKSPATTPAARGGSGSGARGRTQGTPATAGGQRRKNNKRKKKR